MRLAFDATTIRGNKTGVGYYSSRLLERLTRIDAADNPIDELLILSNLPFSNGHIPRTRTAGWGNLGARAVWMQGMLPLILKRKRPDLCHFTNFLAPVVTDTPYVVTFHT